MASIIYMNVFFTNTPYHVLLSYSIAQENNKNLLFASGEEPGRELIETITEHPSAPFEKMIVTDEKVCENRLLRVLERRRNTRNIKSFVSTIDTPVQNVYVFNKGSSEALGLFHFLNSNAHGYETGVYVEDGMEAYSSHEFSTKSTPILKIGKILYGGWWHDPTPLYDSKYIQQVRATFPDALRPELQELPSHSISPEPLLGPDMKEIINEYFETLDIQIPESISHVVIAPHSNLVAENPQLARRIESVIATIDDPEAVAIKYHPRDQSASYLDIDAFEIPARIPMETVYISCTDLERIIGGRSSAVITAKWLTDAEVMSICFALEDTDSVINSTLNKLHIKSTGNLGDQQ